jgi:hypothetical protein
MPFRIANSSIVFVSGPVADMPIAAMQYQHPELEMVRATLNQGRAQRRCQRARKKICGTFWDTGKNHQPGMLLKQWCAQKESDL